MPPIQSESDKGNQEWSDGLVLFHGSQEARTLISRQGENKTRSYKLDVTGKRKRVDVKSKNKSARRRNNVLNIAMIEDLLDFVAKSDQFGKYL